MQFEIYFVSKAIKDEKPDKLKVNMLLQFIVLGQKLSRSIVILFSMLSMSD